MFWNLLLQLFILKNSESCSEKDGDLPVLSKRRWYIFTYYNPYSMSIDFAETFPIPEGLTELNDLYFSIIWTHRLVGKNIQKLSGLIELKELHFSDKINFDAYFSFEGTMYFKNCYFSNDQPFNDISIKKIVFDNCVFYNEISLGVNCKVGKWEILSSKCKRFIVKGGQIDSLELSNNYIQCVFVGGCLINRFSITSSTDYFLSKNIFSGIDLLSISFSELKSSLVIGSCHIRIILLNGYINKETSLFLRYVSFVNIELLNVINEGRLVFSNLNLIDFIGAKLPLSPKEDNAEVVEQPEFRILQCNLGKTEFYSINFTRFKDLQIHDSFILDCLFVNIIWPKRLNISNGYNYKDLYDARFKREVYRQIKIALSKQGDLIGEHKFHALEMNTFYYALKWNKDSWTKLIIRLSYLTSNYGQSVYRPLLSILIFNFPLFYCLVQRHEVSSISDIQNKLTQSEIIVVWAGEFIKYCNPLHKLDVELFGWSFIVDTIMRIVSSYGIYNVVRATRRFVK